MKKLVFALLILGLVPLASAEILFSQVDDIYNFGDKIFLDIELRPSSDTTGFFNIDLSCNDKEVQIYRVPYSLESGESQEVSLAVSLQQGIVGNVSGVCFLEGSFGDEDERSSSFEISRKVDVSFSMDEREYIPGEKVIVSGRADLESGKDFDGFVEVSVEGTNITLTEEVISGEFNFSISLPENIRSGESELKVRAYQKDGSGLVTNEGANQKTFSVKTVLKKLDLDFDSQGIVPGDENLIYTVRVYDQAGEEVSEKIGVIITSSDDEVFFDSEITSSESVNFKTYSNFSVGHWSVKVFVDDLEAKELVYFEENEEIYFYLANDTLVITNIGNVLYDNEIVITIGETSLTKEIVLDIGETKKFRLKAPDDQYNVKVSANGDELVANSVGLTGRAIDIGEVRGGVLGFSVVGSLALLLIIVVIIVMIYKRRKKKGNLPDKKMGVHKGGVSVVSAPSSVYVGGKKEDATIIALKIKKAGKAGEEVLHEALMMAKNKGAKVYLSENFRLMVFSTGLTKSLNNEVLASKLAKDIGEMLDAFNKSSREKINYGIGVNSGQIILEVMGEETKVTSLGSLISGAKNLADMSKSNILVSEKVHVRLSGEVKTQATKGKLKAWQITKVLDRGRHNKFIDEFKKKQRK